MRGTVLYGPRDIRFEDRETPRIEQPTDAVIRIARPACAGRTCGRTGACSRSTGPQPMGHEYCGIVEEVGSAVQVGEAGAVRRRLVRHVRQHLPELPVRLPVLVRAPRVHDAGAGADPPRAAGGRHAGADARTSRSDDLVPSLLATSDVLGTGWFAADAANVKPGSTVVVVGDGAVGLLGVLSAKQMGAERIIAMSRHEQRQKLAREFGATDIVTERGDEGVQRIMEMTKGIGADSVLECVGTQESMQQAIQSTRRGGYVSLRRRPARGRVQGRGTVLHPRPPPRGPRPGAALPAQADRTGAGPEDRPRQGVRPDAAAGAGGRGLPGDGRAAGDQDATTPLNVVPFGQPLRDTHGPSHRAEPARPTSRRPR